MWGHGSSGGTGSSTGRLASPGSTGEEEGDRGRRKEESEEGEGDTGDDSASSNTSGITSHREKVKACDEGDRKGGDSSCDKMEGGGYYPAHPNHHGHGGVHQPLVRGGGYPGGPLEEGEVVRRRGGPGAGGATRDGVVIIERRPSQEGIQPAEMQVLKSPVPRIWTATNLALGSKIGQNWRIHIEARGKILQFFIQLRHSNCLPTATLTLDQSS